MNKILLIVQREYLTRVRKRSFLVMTLIGPVLMAAVFIVPIYISTLENDLKVIAVLDETGIFAPRFQNSETLQFVTLEGGLEDAKRTLTEKGYYALLHIPGTDLSIPQTGIIYSTKQMTLNPKSYIRNVMSKEVEDLKLAASGIDPAILKSIKANIRLSTVKISKGGEEKNSSSELSTIVGFVSAFLIYIFIFIYGSQVMRGVIEEKMNRIVEVIVSSVRPFQLMMGKIVGVAAVGLTQFILWVLLTAGIVTIFTATYGSRLSDARVREMTMTNGSMVPGGSVQIEKEMEQLEGDEVIQVFSSISSINFGLMIVAFLIYFLGGYLLFSALFAAIGSAVDNETDTQQFMLPITIPLILAIVMTQYVINNPDGPVAFWLSMIPFTSPVIMMMRIPFGIQSWELFLSVILLVMGFLGTVWLASRIYRTGILMYGKKVSYRELWKWLSYKG